MSVGVAVVAQVHPAGGRQEACAMKKREDAGMWGRACGGV